MSHRWRARTGWDLAGNQPVGALDVVLDRPFAPDHRVVESISSRSFTCTGNTSGQSASCSTACMNWSVISRLRNWRSKPVLAADEFADVLLTSNAQRIAGGADGEGTS